MVAASNYLLVFLFSIPTQIVPEATALSSHPSHSLKSPAYSIYLVVMKLIFYEMVSTVMRTSIKSNQNLDYGMHSMLWSFGINEAFKIW